MPTNNFSKRRIFAAAILTFIVLSSAQAFCQSVDSSLTGVVQDQKKGVVVGAIVTVENKGTASEIIRSTDGSGRYGLLGLQPGQYTVTIEAKGFKKFKKDIKISATSQEVLNVQMELGREDQVSVTAEGSIEAQIAGEGPNFIQTIDEEYRKSLPNLSNNVIDLVSTIGGVITAPGTDQSRMMIMGTPADGVQLIRDGVNINEVRWNTGIQTPSHINQDIIDEFKVVMSPADAEYGRGGPQIILTSKTGTNQYRGAINFNGSGNFLSSGWGRNNFNRALNVQNQSHNYSASFSGPIIQKKLFFFANWDRTTSRQRQDVGPVVLTPCARKGIYRYFSGFGNGNATNAQAAGAWDVFSIIKTVHTDGTPAPENANGAALQLQSVFGQLDPNSRALLDQDPINCSAYDPYENLGVSTYWETGANTPGLRQLDGSGMVKRFTDMMPLPNDWGQDSVQFGGFVGNNTSAGNVGDGLNTAINKWTRITTGKGTAYASSFGSQPARKTLNANVNWNISDRHRATVNYMREFQNGSNITENWSKEAAGPGFYSGNGDAIRHPSQIGVNVTSTLKPNMLNEIRIGLARTVSHQFSPMDDPNVGAGVREMLQYLVPTDNFPYYQGLPIVVGLGPQAPPSSNGGFGTASNLYGMNQTPSSFTFSPEGNGGYNWSQSSYAAGSHPYGTSSGQYSSATLIPTFGGTDHRWTITDNFTWMHGAHSVRVGGDVRLTKSYQESEGGLNSQAGFGGASRNTMTSPTAYGGISPYSMPGWQYPTSIGLVGNQMNFNVTAGGALVNASSGTYGGMLDLLTYMSGSLSEIRQLYFVNDPYQSTWNDVVNKRELMQIVDMRQKEFSIFAKDDWRVRPTFTVNLGVRWEYYGVPFLANGMTVGLQGGGLSMFGVTGRSISSWLPEKPVQLDDSYLTKQIFIGPGSPHPSAVLYNRDFNNFGPAVGFSWQLPWFGRGKTIIRSGYQLSYRTVGNASNTGFGASIANVPGTIYNQYYRGSSTDTYLSVANLADHVPASRFLDPSIVPLDVLKITDHSQNYTSYDPNIRTPYTHNVNLSLTRIIKNSITIDLRYVATLSRKGVGDINLNTPNVFRNTELFNALNEVRSGKESPLFDKMLGGVVFSQYYNNTQSGTPSDWLPVGAPGGPTGAAVMKSIYATNLAMGDYAAIATSLANMNYDKKVTNTQYSFTAGTNNSRYGEDIPINTDFADIPYGQNGTILRHANSIYPGMFPENYIVANTQMGKADLRSNLVHSNYHSMQAQVQLRPTRGLMLTSTYTLAKQLAEQPGGNNYSFFGGGNDTWTDPLNRSLDYKMLNYGHLHELRNNGIMDLPIGANGYFLRGLQNGLLRRLLEGWQFSWTMQMASGSPSQVSNGAQGGFGFGGGTNHFYNNGTLLDLVPLMDPTLNPTQDAKYGMELSKKLAPGKGSLDWPAGSQNGYFYSGGVNTPSRYIGAKDPQCTNTSIVGSTLAGSCTLNALYLAIPNGDGTALPYAGNEAKYASRIILQNTLPGHQGNFGRFIEGVGTFTLDMGLMKDVMITEGKRVRISMQATNILNHQSPCGSSFGGGSNNCPSLGVGGGAFGTVARSQNYGYGWGQRQFQGNFRLLF